MEVANIMSDLQSALAAAERVFALMDEIPEAADMPGAIELGRGEEEVRERWSCPTWTLGMTGTGLFCMICL